MVDDHAVELPFAANLLIVRNDDRPGMIGIVGSALGDAGVSITNMAVGQTSGGGTALMLLSTDRPVLPEVLNRVRAAAGILGLHYVAGT
jgi:D-3-phosphoglycerate dehydrogenase